MDFTPPAKDCRLCERLCSFREANRLKFPSYHNAPVEPFGSLDAEILIVGLAPGLNRRKPDQPPVYQRLCRRRSLSGSQDIRSCARQLPKAQRRRLRTRQRPHHQCGTLRTAGKQADHRRRKKLPAVPGCGNRRHAEFKGYPMPRHYLAQKRPSGAGTETVVCQIFPRRRISAAVRHSFLRRAFLFFCYRFPCRDRPVLFLFRPRPAASLSRCAAFPLPDAYRQLSHLALQY